MDISREAQTDKLVLAVDSGELHSTGFELPYFSSHYKILAGTEQTDPELAFACQVIQGISYADNSFVYESKGALDEYGRLKPELDRTRGENVEYRLAVPATFDSGETSDIASVRVVHIPQGGVMEDLPSLKYAKTSIYPAWYSVLEKQISEVGSDGVVEIAALANTRCGGRENSGASFELIRSLFQESLLKERPPLWVITLVPHAHAAFLGGFGPHVVNVIGSPVAIDVGDERTSDELRITPVIIDPKMVFSNIKRAYDDSDNFTKARHLLKSALFMSDGLDLDALDPHDAEFISQLRKENNYGA